VQPDHVTGASSGIGKAIALGLAGRGASLCLLGRDLGALQLVADAAKTSICHYQTDLEIDREVQQVIANIRRDIKSIHILVHSDLQILAAGKLNQSRCKLVTSAWVLKLKQFATDFCTVTVENTSSKPAKAA
jgi:NADP-dependent 3-hydroxy acid dehydrogenase YdfG